MDQSRYEEVPKKEGKAGKAFKNFGKYLKTVMKSIVESFKYNKMKLPAFLLGIGGVIIGLFLSVHAATIQQLTYTYSYVDQSGEELVKYTANLPGMPYDYTGVVIFILMLLGILNIFIALAFNSKQNKGSVVSATIITVVMIGLTIAYVYAITYFKQYHDSGIEVNGTLYKLDLAGGGYEANFEGNYMKSMIVLFIADALSLVACVLGFIHYNRAYEKGDER
ncbi:hypothetical protein EI71_00780 [Anaeroplasma bactoclasticum]|jgi:hypothetical protein|uniref:Uncharacterized protein n=1 Tax=Anaeroplasma bactoclasticum TaxID=2088 RepID=A0A397S6C8_9MOLU|nr:hypothetical protein [Anaeroplasma bactoclasticum]RIA77804.1 hypothetical protein EI71_00780 [Anaeroplasma bactoclasticum]